MRIAVLGGSFNPVHIGHLALADSVCSELGYDKVLFVPALNPPHKEMAFSGSVSAMDRLSMVRLACADDPRFSVEPCEIERAGISYTYDTVCFLREKYGDVLEDRLGLILGSDLHSGFRMWRRAQDLAKTCTLILARRPPVAGSGDFAREGWNAVDGEFSADDEPLFKDALRLSNPELAVSSSQIRAAAARGSGFKYLVPGAVFKYIRDGGLYADR